MRLLLFFFCVTVLLSCKPGRPSGVLSEDKMEDILVDYHLALAAAETQSGDLQENRYLLTQAVLRKHRVSEARFDTSLVYWCQHSERFYDISANVSQRLSYMVEEEGVDRQEKNAYSYLATEGDTANVWNLRDHVVLLPNRVENIYSFAIDADSTYLPGDNFMWAFNTIFVSNYTNGEVFALLSVHFDNDSIMGITRRMTSGRQNEIRLNCPERYKDLNIRSINGTIYMPTREDGFGIVSVSDFVLVRYHDLSAKAGSNAESPDSLSADTAAVDTSVTGMKDDTMHVRRNPYDIRDEQGDRRTINIVKDKPVRFPTRRR